MQAVSGSVTALSTGLLQVRSEIKAQRQAKNTPAEDRFVQVMEVCGRILLNGLPVNIENAAIHHSSQLKHTSAGEHESSS